MILRIGVSHFESADCLVWCPKLFLSRDQIHSICHVTSQEHVIKGSRFFMGERSLGYFATFPSIVTIDIAIVEI